MLFAIREEDLRYIFAVDKSSYGGCGRGTFTAVGIFKMPLSLFYFSFSLQRSWTVFTFQRHDKIYKFREQRKNASFFSQSFGVYIYLSSEI